MLLHSFNHVNTLAERKLFCLHCLAKAVYSLARIRAAYWLCFRVCVRVLSAISLCQTCKQLAVHLYLMHLVHIGMSYTVGKLRKHSFCFRFCHNSLRDTAVRWGPFIAERNANEINNILLKLFGQWPDPGSWYCDMPGSPCLSKNKANHMCNSFFFIFCLGGYLHTYILCAVYINTFSTRRLLHPS